MGIKVGLFLSVIIFPAGMRVPCPSACGGAALPGGIYDSPTFLSQKDKYMAGLTLPQLMVCMVIAVFVFALTLMLPFGFLVRLMFVIPGTGLGAFLAFGKIFGLSVPMFSITAILFPFRSPV